MSSVKKVCRSCGETFDRPSRLSSAQWSARQYCSRSCAAKKTTFSDAEIVAFYEGGKSSPEIAEIVGICPVQVRRVLRAAGFDARDLKSAMQLSHSRQEVKNRMSRSAKGRTHTEETKRKLRSVIGPDHALWRGGLTLSAGGYLEFTKSEANGAHAGRYLHRVIAEWVIGRSIEPDEHVHHRDGNKLNNSPENLEVMKAVDHARHHAIENGLGKKRYA
ncbi:HNH endonuclease signature motif containing protein [Roseovarius nitratireducens]|uniref:HNH endonuclease signature motif containing protein n=1 Tax=Roseovarius nitratireducens TaxID=2044597 RepID=UPI0019823DC2|nr:HNH endonuclease signature motif containing protein [Roseovarius nitratireducens]